MKEAVRGRGASNSNANVRSAVEKERTKMRERQRRSITTNIFHGLRKHGGYRLSPRADINEVLRHLAQEAGWIIEPDGTTYRSTTAASTNSNGTNSCLVCGGGRKSAPPTPSCSVLGGGGESSTSTSPRHITVGDSTMNNLSSGGLLPSSFSSTSSVMATNDTLLAVYMCGAAPPQTGCASVATCSPAYREGQHLYLLHEASVANQNTLAGSP
ncbi:BES1/BZR1protein 4 [Sesamum alatum]|uniref:Protein BZR1 homolog n=1 Tax=Sesamum alatum TaxID=300844 RepID=A0AAE1Z2D0_9LAMI|nr:BES1/BZR1protein 4 [Sesamum alatum]